MLTEEQKAEIRRLKGLGLNISQTAKQMGLDWKTVKKVWSEDADNGKRSSNSYPQNNNPQIETNLVKIVFEKLNSGISPREIIAQIGNVDLVADCHNKWVALGEHPSKDLSLPDPKVVGSWDAWEKSVEMYFGWHQKKAIKTLAAFAWIRMESCANLKNKGVACPQLEEGADPYECISCQYYSEAVLT